MQHLFHNTDDYVDAGSNASFNVSNITIAAWAKSNSSTQTGDDAIAFGYYLWIQMLGWIPPEVWKSASELKHSVTKKQFCLGFFNVVM